MITEKEGIPFTGRKKVSSMRGRKGLLGSMKGEAKTRGRTVGTLPTGSSVKGLGRTGGGLETGHVTLGHGNRIRATGKKGAHK